MNPIAYLLSKDYLIYDQIANDNYSKTHLLIISGHIVQIRAGLSRPPASKAGKSLDLHYVAYQHIPAFYHFSFQPTGIIKMRPLLQAYKCQQKILQARNPKLLVQKRRMLTFRDKNGIF